MASSGKKSKRVKGKTLGLQELHAEIGTTPVGQVQRKLNWADDVEDEENIRRAQVISLPTAPRASRILFDDSIPNQPPFLVKLSNLPYDVDESALEEFFDGLSIEHIKLPRDDVDSSRSRGFGYIKFVTKEDLIGAVQMSDPVIRNRRIKIDIATENDQKHGGGGSNWRERQGQNDGEGGNRRGFSFRDRDRDAQPSEESGNWRDESRPQDSPPPQRRNNYGDRGDRDRDRGGDRDRERGGDRDRDSSFKRRDRGGDRDRDEVLQERPKLNLQPRTLPIEHIIPSIVEKEPEVAVHKPEPVPAAKIFGDAKPVDTTAREREIEERLEKERKAAFTAAKEAKEAKENEKQDEPSEPENIEPELVQKLPTIVDEEIMSWRNRKDDNDEDDEKSRNSPPSQRKYSPARDYKGDRRGPPRRNNDRDYDRRPNNRDYRNDRGGSDRDNRIKDNRDHRNNDRGYDRDRNADRGDRGYDRDRNNDRYGQNKQNRDSRNRNHDNNQIRKDIRSAPPPNRDKNEEGKESTEDRMPKYQPPSGPNLSMSNKFAFLDIDDVLDY